MCLTAVDNCITTCLQSEIYSQILGTCSNIRTLYPDILKQARREWEFKAPRSRTGHTFKYTLDRNLAQAGAGVFDPSRSKLLESMATTFRNLLVFTITSDNGTRLQGAMNMKRSEFYAAKQPVAEDHDILSEDEAKNYRIVFIAEHKGKDTAPIRMAIPNHVFEAIGGYIWLVNQIYVDKPNGATSTFDSSFPVFLTHYKSQNAPRNAGGYREGTPCHRGIGLTSSALVMVLVSIENPGYSFSGTTWNVHMLSLIHI